MSSRRARWRSPAKVNLALRVVGRRSDGYHLLDSVFVPIDWCDELTVTVRELGHDAATRVAVRCDVAGVPDDATNLAARAAVAVLAERGLRADVEIAIAKTIPPGSGLGGGSGNAATMLRGLDAGLDLAIAPSRLAAIALTLGADVPFFLTGTPARVRGIGEDVEPIAGWTRCALVVAVPPVAVSTAWAFRAFAEAVPTLPTGAEPATEAARLAGGEAPGPQLLVNDLERVVLPAHPRIAALKALMLDAGASAAVMSGSGSAVVALAPSAAAAARIADDVRRRAPDVAVRAVATLGGPLQVDRLVGAA